jgi:predicted nucleotidyltransferase
MKMPDSSVKIFPNGSLPEKTFQLLRGTTKYYCFDTNICKFEIMNGVIKSNLSEIKGLLLKYGVIKAYLFGSAAGGEMTDDSDVDFMVTFNPNLNYTDYGNNYFQLIYDLQTLLKKNVDIIAEETITNPYLLQTINSKKIAVL